MGLRAFLKPRFPASVDLEIDGARVAVTVRVSERAKSYRLSLSPRSGPVLTVPRKGRWADAEAFLLRHKGWLAARLEKAGNAPALAPGAYVPVRGVPHLVVALEARRGLVQIVEGDDGPQVRVPGGPEHCRRRLLDWLKAEARADLERAASQHADTLGVQIAALSLRDQVSRWGSCSAARQLNFNWRLVMAPPFVLDYVAAHEVAHILEMNHAPAFWRTVKKTLPDYERGKAWLKANGSTLMKIN